MDTRQLLKTPQYRRWSKGAIECYKRNCICFNCPTYDLIGKQCKMKYAVLQLVKTCGLPDEVNTKQIEIKESEEKQMFDNDLKIEYPNYLEKLITAVKKGFDKYGDIEKETGLNGKTASVYFDGFYKLLEQKNLIKQSDKSKRQAVCDFIQSRLLDTEYRETKPNDNAANKETIEEPKKEKSNNELEILKSENKKLKQKISELENQPKSNIDFSEIKEKIKSEIKRLNNLLEIIEKYNGDVLTLISEIAAAKV